jgi:putative molybdopterin biosynthesis protein
MAIYLHDIPLPEAQSHFKTALEKAGLLGILGTDVIPLDEHACGRVLAEPVWAKISSPHYHASAMDGFAVLSVDTEGAMPTAPVTLTCEHSNLQCIYVDTGDPLPEWADAVIPIENVESLDNSGQPAQDARHPATIRIRSAVTPWSHVRPMGEDIVATQLVLPSGHTLKPVDLGAIAACGHHLVKVAYRPRVAVIPTGTELVEIGTVVRPGDIIEYNSLVLSAQVNNWGGIASRYPITRDEFQAIRAQVNEAAQTHDLVLLNAGSSAGSEDFSARVVESLGQLLVHGVAVRPGHPVILGMLDMTPRSVPIIGVPGYPVSAALTGEIFVEPLLARWLGRAPYAAPTIQARLTRKITSPGGDDDYIRVAVGKVDRQVESERDKGTPYLAAPLSRGSGVITSLVRADGLAILPRGVQGLPAGAEVKVHLYRPQSEIEHTIFAIGSHDILLDLIAQYLSLRQRRLSSANVGSLGGLIALRRGEAHIAGSHLLDPETGEYNISYIKEYLPGIPVRLVTLAGRQQGLLVASENPKNIKSLTDLARPDVVFVNRQRGAGTRVLLDYELGKISVATESIQGYNQEEYTHLAVAAAVASGRADCGLGITAAAIALGLDFVPLFQERYDLVIPRQFAEDELLAPLFDILADQGFKKEASQIPGYDLTQMGNLVMEFN